jgi:hypothetical protein
MPQLIKSIDTVQAKDMPFGISSRSVSLPIVALSPEAEKFRGKNAVFPV